MSWIYHQLGSVSELLGNCMEKFKLILQWVKIILKRGKSNWLREYQLISDIWAERFPSHYKKISLSILEKTFMTVLIFIRSLSLSHISDFFSNCKIRSEIAEFYVLAGLVGLLWLLWHPLPLIILLSVVVYRIINELDYGLCIVFVGRYKLDGGVRSISRSLLLLMLNYCEIIIGFAILYLPTQSVAYSNSSKLITTPIEALYFSTVTITTLGYGDMRPVSPFGQKLALLEPLLGFILVVLVIGVFLTRVEIKEIAQEKERNRGS